MTLRVFALGTAIAAALVGQCAVVLADQIPSRRVDPGAALSADARLKAIPMQRTVKSLRPRHGNSAGYPPGAGGAGRWAAELRS